MSGGHCTVLTSPARCEPVQHDTHPAKRQEGWRGGGVEGWGGMVEGWGRDG